MKGSHRRTAVGVALCVELLTACRTPQTHTAACSLDDHAREYVELVAALGARDHASVDSPLLPPRRPLTAGLIRTGARDLRAHIEAVHGRDADSGRADSFVEMLDAIDARAEQLAGGRLSFDDEMRRMFGDLPASLPADPDAIGALGRTVPGSGPLATRLAAYDEKLRVPASRLPAVMARALDACREATRRHISLPDGERLDVAYVAGSPWSGYSRYQGRFRSTIEVNAALGLTVDRVLDLACHEGYPGHHALSALREQRLAVEHGWTEITAVPTFSPESYALESLASAAPRLVFTKAERIQLEQDILFPLAGLDPREAATHVEIGALLWRLDGTVAALTRAYLTGELNRLTATAVFRNDAAMAHPEATLTFIDQYRGYSTAYTAGRSMAWQLISRDAPDEDRWRHYLDMALTARLGSEARGLKPVAKTLEPEARSRP